MIDFGDEAPLEAAHVFADPGDVDVEGEPEVRLPCLSSRSLKPARLLSLSPRVMVQALDLWCGKAAPIRPPLQWSQRYT